MRPFPRELSGLRPKTLVAKLSAIYKQRRPLPLYPLCPTHRLHQAESPNPPLIPLIDSGLNYQAKSPYQLTRITPLQSFLRPRYDVDNSYT